jgi:hypothetical protein
MYQRIRGTVHGIAYTLVSIQVHVMEGPSRRFQCQQGSTGVGSQVRHLYSTTPRDIHIGRTVLNHEVCGITMTDEANSLGVEILSFFSLLQHSAVPRKVAAHVTATHAPVSE